MLGSLEELGYSCWPIVVGAVHVGAPIQRKRGFIVAIADKKLGRSRVRISKHVQGKKAGISQATEQRFNADKWTLDSAPRIGRVDARIPGRVDRLQQLGNSVCPQVVEAIAKAWMKAETCV